MVQALRRRTAHDEEGFTLIELMVVVLIIAILLAIAIPTFLGARGKAQSRATQSNLRNALTAEKTIFTDAQQYSGSVAATTAPLLAVEPSLTWIVTGSPTGNQILAVASTGNATNSHLVLTSLDPGNKCWFISDEAQAGATAAPGTEYAWSTPVGSPAVCAAPAVVTATPALGPATVTGTWYQSW